jgi:hypothetical protein
LDFPGLGQADNLPQRYLKISKKLDFISINVYTIKRRKEVKR